MKYDELIHNYAGLFDAFGNVSVSTQTNRADVEFIYDKQPFLMEDLSSGNGTVVHNANTRDLTLSVGGADNGDTGHIRHKTWIPYTPGNGQVQEVTGTLDLAGLGGGTMQVFLRTSISGSVVTNAVSLSNWNGAGTFAVEDFDPKYSSIFAINFQSLKVGSISFGLIKNKIFYPVHQINNDNIRNSGFWQYASLPPYWKIYNTATQTIAELGYGDDANGVGFRYVWSSVQSTATMKAICTTVKSSNGDDLRDIPGFPLSASNGVTAITGVSTTLVPILSIRVAATINSIANRGLYIPESFQISTDNPIHYKILYRPTLTSASWTAVNTTYSGMEYDVSASAVTGGIAVKQGYIETGLNQRVIDKGILDRLSMSLGSSADILTIAVVKTGATNASVKSAIEWKEVR